MSDKIIKPSKSTNLGKNRQRVMHTNDWANPDFSEGNGNKLFPGQVGFSTNNSLDGQMVTHMRVGPATTLNNGIYPATSFTNSMKVVPEANTITNGMIHSMNSKTMIGNRTNSSASPTDVTISQLTGILDRFGSYNPSAESGSAAASTSTSRGLVDASSGNDDIWLGGSDKDRVLRQDGKWARQIKLLASGAVVNSSNGSFTDTITMTPVLSGSNLSFSLTHAGYYSASKLAGQVGLGSGGTGVNSTSIANNKFFAGPVSDTGPAGFRSLAYSDLSSAGLVGTSSTQVAQGSHTHVYAGSNTVGGRASSIQVAGGGANYANYQYLLGASSDKVDVSVVAANPVTPVIHSSIKYDSTGWLTASGFIGSGTGITSINANNISNGVLPVKYGGTGWTSLAAYGLLCGGNTTTSVRSLTPALAGCILVSKGTTAWPEWSNTPTGLTSISATAFYATSDRRLKENISKYNYNKSILDLEVKQYNWKDTKKKSFGMIAQEVKELFPEIVSDEKDGSLSIEEGKLTYLLLLEVKKLRKELGLNG